MNIKILLFSTLLIFVFAACKHTTVDKIIERYPNNSPKLVKHYNNTDTTTNYFAETGFYQNGNKQYTGQFKNNKRNGKWAYWYENGTIWSKGFYNNGLRSGKSQVYHKNGNIFFTGYYKNGVQNGKWKYYNNKGELLNTVTYKNGIIVKQN